MKEKIFKYVFSLSMAVFLITGTVFSIGLYVHFSKEVREETRETAAVLKEAYEKEGEAALKTTAVKKVTLKTSDGKIKNYGTDKQAHDQNWVTLPLKDGGSLTVYSARPSLSRFIINIFYPLVIGVFSAVLIALFLASHMAKNLVKPLNEINLENPDDRDIYDELKPLARRIVSQNRQIYRQMKQLRREHARQDKLRREFTANVTHELKTPLTAISGSAEILKNGLVQPQDVPHFADNIYKESQRMITLVGDIIELSELEDGSQKLSKSDFSVFPIVEQAVKRLSPSAKKRDVALSFSCPEDVTLYGSSALFEEILCNLLDNAIKYNRPGGRATATVKRCDTGLKLSVSDTGIGIEKTEQERIFERFYRVNKSRSKEVGGTGLGLSIVKHAAVYFGAVISVDSTPNVGTTVTVRFPMNK